MTRYVDEPIEVKVQVVDSNYDPVTTATVNWKLYDETDVEVDSGTMSHFANGMYTQTVTPDAAGEWTFEAYSANPKFRTSKVYNVEAGGVVFQDQNSGSQTFSPPVINVWNTVCTLTDGIEILLLSIRQGNDETNDKTIEIELTIDGVVLTGTVPILLPNNSTRYLQMLFRGSLSGNGVAYNPYESNFAIINQGTSPQTTIAVPYPCKSLLFRVRITDAAGTNQTLTGSYSWRQLLPV